MQWYYKETVTQHLLSRLIMDTFLMNLAFLSGGSYSKSVSLQQTEQAGLSSGSSSLSSQMQSISDISLGQQRIGEKISLAALACCDSYTINPFSLK